MGNDLIRQRLQRLDAANRSVAIAAMTAEELIALDHHWPSWAHHGQLEPADGSDGGGGFGSKGWRSWVIMAGRGFGKTRAGAEWVIEQVRAADAAGDPPPRIALVAATLHEARRVMVEGASGLLSVGGGWIAGWQSSFGRLQFRGGAEANLFSGASPDGLRGPEHHFAWCSCCNLSLSLPTPRPAACLPRAAGGRGIARRLGGRRRRGGSRGVSCRVRRSR